MKTGNIARSITSTEYLRYLWWRPEALRIVPERSAPSCAPVATMQFKRVPGPQILLASSRNLPTGPRNFVPGGGLLGRALLSLLLVWLGLFAAEPARAQTGQCPETNVLKYVQPPQIDGGFDLWDTGPWALADDFICTNTGPITDIHLWGAWLNDMVDFNTTFWLAIYDDVPAVTNGPVTIPSRPGTNLVWQQYFGPGQYAQSQVNVGIGNFYNPEPPGIMGNDSKVYYYCFYPTNPPTQTGTVTQAKTYWLAVYAMPSQGTAFMFGWKNAQLQQHDICTRTPWPGIAPITTDWRPNYDPSNRGLDLAFKINTATNNQPPPPPCCPETNTVKFIQRPKVPGGLDVNASQNLVLADDFICTNTGPIMDIHLWGSWLQDMVDPAAMFTLSIWSDVPKQTNAAGGVTPSHPGIVLWSEPFGPGEYYQCLYTNTTEQFFDPSIPGIIGGDTKVDYLCFYPRNPFRQTGTTAAPTNYWLSVNAQTTAGGQMLFGWHTSYEYYNDIAVWGIAPFPAAWSPMIDLQGNPLSMAFKVNTRTNPPCPPGTIICPPNKTVECGTAWHFDDPRATNACCGTNITLTIVNTITNGTCPQLITRTWLVTDCSGFTANCSQTVTVVDTTPPVFTYCPTNRTVECGTPWQFDVPTATDSCCLQAVFLSGVVTNGTCPQVITGTWVARDCCGNTNFCSQTITVVDTIPPVFTSCPSNRTVECGSPWEFGTPIATDNCCLQGVSVLGTFTNGTCPQVVTRIWLARDCCGNTNTCTETVTIVDTTPPVLTCATNKTVECGTPWTFDPPVATDNCCLQGVALLGTFTNGNCPQFITRFWIATDCCSNSSSCSQTVTVVDTTPPTLTCATNKTVECGTPWTFDPPTATDNCCTNPVVSVVSTITNGSPCDYTISRTWVAIDCCQNRSIPCTQIVRVVDTLPPTVTCPTNMIVDSCNTNVVVTWIVVATDNCGTNITVTSTPPSGSTFVRGTTNTVHVVATDGCGNTNTCDFTILVERPKLGIVYNPGPHTITLTWSDGILQSADNVVGPYSDVPLATSPYTVAALAPQKFYRLRCP